MREGWHSAPANRWPRQRRLVKLRSDRRCRVAKRGVARLEGSDMRWKAGCAGKLVAWRKALPNHRSQCWASATLGNLPSASGRQRQLWLLHDNIDPTWTKNAMRKTAARGTGPVVGACLARRVSPDDEGRGRLGARRRFLPSMPPAQPYALALSNARLRVGGCPRWSSALMRCGIVAAR